MNFLPFFWGPLLVAQFVLTLFLGMYNDAGIVTLVYIGWGIWIISLVFAWMPLINLKRKGGVDKGKSFVHTKVLVDTGLYSVIRHPQYTSGILFGISLAMISQNWIVVFLGVPVVVLVYLDTMVADLNELEKFGDDYRDYMKRVPRTNFILGIIRLVLRRRSRGEK